jgi:hypothetical protein
VVQGNNRQSLSIPMDKEFELGHRSGTPDARRSS